MWCKVYWLCDGHCTVFFNSQIERIVVRPRPADDRGLRLSCCRAVPSIADHYDEARAERFVALPPAADYDDGGMITSEAYVRYAREWVAAGASIVGGCCGIGPAHMKAVCEALAAADTAQ